MKYSRLQNFKYGELFCGPGGMSLGAKMALIKKNRTQYKLTHAWANDIDYNLIFSRQIDGIGNSGDILIAISTSGNSMNILRAVEKAISKNLKVIILAGQSSGKLDGMGDVHINIPSKDTQRIQEGHLLAEHILCEIVESQFLS